MIAALVLAAAVATPSRAIATPQHAIESFTLSNGIRVYVQRMPSRETVVLGTVALSPAFDPPGKEGLGAVASGVLHAHGTATFEYGAQFGAHVAAAQVGRALITLARNARDASAPADTFSGVVDDETQTAAQRASDIAVRAQRAFDNAIYGNSDPVVRVETARSLAAITPADVRAFVQRTFVPQHTTIVIAGDVDPRILRAQLQRSFGRWQKAATVPPLALPRAPQTLNSVTVITSGDDTNRLRMGQATLGRNDPDFYALNIANVVLSMRLAHALANAAASSSLLTTRERGVLAIDATVPLAEINPDRALIRSNVARLRTERIPETEWNDARARLLSAPGVTDPSQPAAVGRLQNLARNDLPPTYFERLASYYAVTPDAGRAAARRHLRSGLFAEVIVTSGSPQIAPPSGPSP